MARTANTGFFFDRDIFGHAHSPAPIVVRIANSTTLRVGDMVRINTAGFVTAAGANPIAGVLTGFRDLNGTNPFSLGYSLGGITKTGDDTLATSSTNQTRADYIMAEVIIDPAGVILWRNKATAAQAQTNLLQYFNLDANSRQVDQSTPSDSNAQVQLIVIDPDGTTIEPNNPATADATIGLYRIAQNQIGLQLDAATAKIVA